MSSQTIAAISTALNSSGIGIVRISGEEALSVAERIFRMPGDKRLSECESHTIHYGHIYDKDQMIDEVLVMLMKGPHSFTTEDTVEINCHGGVFVVQKVLELALKNGARLAEPGEFTKRAFLGGRIDLSQAEAVMDVIQSQNEYALEASMRQLRGDVSQRIRGLRSEILYQIAFIESALDDPEHISLEGYPDTLKPEVIKWMAETDELIRSFENGRRMTEGIKTVIVGKPNAGKSSILNLLAGEERAIVTDVAGTTRDVLEENIILDGISLRLLDTAGIRSTNDLVESIGVERALKHVKDSDLVLYVVDMVSDLDDNDRMIMKEISGKQTILLFNKTDKLQNITDSRLCNVTDSENSFCFKEETNHEDTDVQERVHRLLQELPDFLRNSRPIPFSAKEHTGVEELTQRIRQMFFDGKVSFNDQVYITNVRHKNLLTEALNSLQLVENSIENGMPEDFYSIDLMNAYEKLGLIIGEEVEDDLVNEIFHRFCMGK